MSRRKRPAPTRPPVPDPLMWQLELAIRDAANPAAMVGAIKLAIWDLGRDERNRRGAG